MEEEGKNVETLIGGDFNALTGDLKDGFRWERYSGRERGESQKTKR